jgi:hypothetical protein
MFKVPTAHEMGMGQGQIVADNTPTQQLSTSTDAFAGNSQQIGDIGNALSNLGNKMGEAQLRIKSREDAIYRANARQKFFDFAEEKFNKFQTEGDMFDPQHLIQFNEDLDKFGNQFIEEHGQDHESGTKLKLAIMDLNSQYKAKARSSVNKQQRILVTNQIGKEISHLVDNVSQDPSQLNSSFLKLGDIMSEYNEALRPDEQIAHLDTARQQLLLGSINSFVDRGQYDEANILVGENPQIFSLLGDTDKRTLQKRIYDGVREQEKENQKYRNIISSVEMFSGRTLSADERIKIMTGIDVNDSPINIGRQNAEILGVDWNNLSPKDRYLLSQNKIPGNDEFDPQTEAGKIINDRQELISTYGENSSQVSKFDLLTQQKTKSFDPQSKVGKIIADRDQLLREGRSMEDPDVLTLTKQIQDEDPEYQKTQELIEKYKPATIALNRFEQQVETLDKNINAALGIMFGTVVNENTNIAALMQEGFDDGIGGSVGNFSPISRILPNSDASNLNNILETIRANIGFEYLQKMRESSPTGGALGNVSERENLLLQSVQGSLNPNTPEQLLRTLTDIKQQMRETLQEKQEAFDSDFSSLETNTKDTASSTNKNLDYNKINEMTVDDLISVDIDSLSEEQLEAFSIRMNELEENK